jgi:hypothetical protein
MRFYTSLSARRTTPTQRVPARHLLLEWLEDRVVPSIPDGTILVTTSPRSMPMSAGTPTGTVQCQIDGNDAGGPGQRQHLGRGDRCYLQHPRVSGGCAHRHRHLQRQREFRGELSDGTTAKRRSGET